MKLPLLALAFALAAQPLEILPARAATVYADGENDAVQGNNVVSIVVKFLNALNKAVGVSATNPLPVLSTPAGSSTPANANTHPVTPALASSLILKASPGNLYSANTTAVTGGAGGFLVLIDSTSVPAPGAITPIDSCYIPAGVPNGCSLFHGSIPIHFSNGIVALVTTAASPFTYTTGDTAFVSGDIQ